MIISTYALQYSLKPSVLLISILSIYCVNIGSLQLYYDCDFLLSKPSAKYYTNPIERYCQTDDEVVC